MSRLEALQGIIIALGIFAGVSESNTPDKPILTVVVNESSTITNLSRAQLRKLLLGDMNHWPDGPPVVLVERDTDSAVYRDMLRKVLQMTALDYKRHLVAVEFQGGQLPLIKTLNSDGGAILFAGSVPGAIAVVGSVSAAGSKSRVRVLRIDGKAPGEAGYPLQ